MVHCEAEKIVRDEKMLPRRRTAAAILGIFLSSQALNAAGLSL